MRRAFILTGLVGIFAGWGPPGWGATPEKRPRSVLADVAALEQPVTYTETKIPLGELIQKVAEDTGVALSASKEVADEPVALVVKELPARELLEQVAERLDYQWSRRRTNDERRTTNGGATRSSLVVRRSSPRYEIYQDLAAKQREEALRQTARAAAEKPFWEQVALYTELASQPQEPIRTLLAAREERSRQLAGMPPEQRRVFLTSPPEKERGRRLDAAQTLASPITRALAQLTGRLSAPQWESLRQQERLFFATAPEPGQLPLPPEVDRLLRSARPQMREPSRPVYPTSPEAEARFRKTLREFPDQWAAATGYHVRFELSGGQVGSLGSMALIVTVSPVRSPAERFPIDVSGRADTTLMVFSAGLDQERLDRSAQNAPQRRAELSSLASREGLRLYAAFTPAQRSGLAQDGNLPVAQMSPRQRELFVAATRLGGGDRALVPADLTNASLALTTRDRISIQHPDERPPRYDIQPLPRAAGATGPAAATDKVLQHPVTTIRLELHWATDVEVNFFFTVASP